MKQSDFTTMFVVDQTSEIVFAAIQNVRGWWSGEVAGETRALGAEFTYTVPGVHFCRMRIAESNPGRSIVWEVLESDIGYVADHAEWTGTRIRFEIAPRADQTEVRFTQEGLVPDIECFEQCSSAWGLLVNGNLRKLIVTGEDQPSVF